LPAEPRLVTAAAFALRGAPISTRQSVVVADAMRSAAMSRFGTLFDNGSTAVFAGKGEDGVPLRGNRHAHWLPVDTDGDDLLDTVVVWAPGGIGPTEAASLGAIRRLVFHPGEGMSSARSLSVALECLAGDDADRRPLERRLGGFFGPALVWRSATPFLPTRHRKREEPDTFLRDSVARELIARDITTDAVIEIDRERAWGMFRRYRRAERLADARPGFGFTLRFSAPVTGPLCLGGLSHFGMGRFVPVYRE
jgi:CRISPR-associated protein Csb2